MLHETKRKCCCIGSSSAAGGIPVRRRFWDTSGSPASGFFAVLRETLEGGGRKEWNGGFRVQTQSRASLTPIRATKGEVTEVVAERGNGPWVYEQPVDITAGKSGDRRPFRSSLPSRSCLEDPAWLWVELSEARAPCQGEKRSRD